MGRPAKGQSLFKSTHELTKMMKALKRINDKAIRVLDQAMDSADEKIRVAAAEKSIKFYADAAKEIRQDQINSTLIEMKMGLIGQGSTVPEDNTPVLNFDELHPDFANKDVVDAENVVDLSDVRKIG